MEKEDFDVWVMRFGMTNYADRLNELLTEFKKQVENEYSNQQTEQKDKEILELKQLQEATKAVNILQHQKNQSLQTAVKSQASRIESLKTELKDVMAALIFAGNPNDKLIIESIEKILED